MKHSLIFFFQAFIGVSILKYNLFVMGFGVLQIAILSSYTPLVRKCVYKLHSNVKKKVRK